VKAINIRVGNIYETAENLRLFETFSYLFSHTQVKEICMIVVQQVQLTLMEIAYSSIIHRELGLITYVVHWSLINRDINEIEGYLTDDVIYLQKHILDKVYHFVSRTFDSIHRIDIIIGDMLSSKHTPRGNFMRSAGKILRDPKDSLNVYYVHNSRIESIYKNLKKYPYFMERQVDAVGVEYKLDGQYICIQYNDSKN